MGSQKNTKYLKAQVEIVKVFSFQNLFTFLQVIVLWMDKIQQMSHFAMEECFLPQYTSREMVMLLHIFRELN